MIDPEDITTGGIKVLKILENNGADGFSVARIKAPNGGQFLGIRWNGSDEPNAKGYPTSRGYPVFFTIPDELEDLISVHYRESGRVRNRSSRGVL